MCGQPPVSTPMMRSAASALVADEELRVFLGVDVVGDDRDVVAVAHALQSASDQRGLAGADRAADADAQGLSLLIVFSWSESQDRKSRVYCVSCRALAIAKPGANVEPISSSASVDRALRRQRRSASPSASSTRCPAIWPSGTSLTAAAPGSRASPDVAARSASLDEDAEHARSERKRGRQRDRRERRQRPGVSHAEVVASSCASDAAHLPRSSARSSAVSRDATRYAASSARTAATSRAATRRQARTASALRAAR